MDAVILVGLILFAVVVGVILTKKQRKQQVPSTPDVVTEDAPVEAPKE